MRPLITWPPGHAPSAASPGARQHNATRGGAAAMALVLLVPGAAVAAPGAASRPASDQRATSGRIPAAEKRSPVALPGLQSLLGKSQPTPPVLAADEAFLPVITARRNGQIQLQWSIAPGYYLYRDRTTYQLRGHRSDKLTDLTPTYARRGELIADPHFGEQVVFKAPVAVSLQMAPDTQAALKTGEFEPGELRIAYQGCLTDRLCYPSQTIELPLPKPAPWRSSAVPSSSLSTRNDSRP